MCSNFRGMWQESFRQANANLEASISYYADAPDAFILDHMRAFTLVNTIAHHYLHNNCTTIPGTFKVASRGDQLLARIRGERPAL